MGNLVYTAIASLDGYIEDRDGNFDWSEPDEVVHQFINDLERPAGVHLYGRRMYETMMVWETDPSLADSSIPVYRDYALVWQAAEKIVFSKTLESVSTRRTRLERVFDPQIIRALKQSVSTEMAIGGPNLAGEAFRAGLVDECRLFLAPVSIGGGKPALPTDLHLNLELIAERRFDNGMMYLRYRVRP